MKFFLKRMFFFCILCSFFLCGNFLFPYLKSLDLADNDSQKTFFYRSVFYPGLAQIYIGKKTKGLTFAYLTTLFISGAIASYADSEKKYRNYLNSLDECYYDEYSRGRDQMFIFLGLTFLTWVYNMFDVSYDLRHFNNNKSDGLNFGFDIDNKGAIVSYSKIY